jgi:hypothetical protein
MCVYVYTYVCMNIYIMYVRMLYMYVCTYVCNIYICIRMYVCIMYSLNFSHELARRTHLISDSPAHVTSEKQLRLNVSVSEHTHTHTHESQNMCDVNRRSTLIANGSVITACLRTVEQSMALQSDHLAVSMYLCRDSAHFMQCQ